MTKMRTLSTIYRICFLNLIILLFLAHCNNSKKMDSSFFKEIKYTELKDIVANLNEHLKNSFWVYLIDIRDSQEFKAGHIEYSTNIEMKTFSDEQGNIIAEGSAIKNHFDDKWPIVVYSSNDNGDAYISAKAINSTGYKRIYYYNDGIDDWHINNSNYLCVTYEGFKDWHDEKFPFNDTDNVLIDVNQASWYSKNGHIPGALNIPIEQLVTNINGVPELINGGDALTSSISNKNAKMVVYNVGRQCQRSAYFIFAAGELGYKYIFRFRIGYDVWIQQGNTLNTGPNP